jgi:hypothetical protein
MSHAQTYRDGWKACITGEDGRSNPHARHSDAACAWADGFIDAMEAADGEEPRPETVGYGEA